MIKLSHTLVFIRHGQTDWNKEARLQGGQDIPINSTGEQQARRNGRVIKDWFADIGRSADEFAFVASPLSRCVKTMTLVREHAELVPANRFETDKQLVEITFGEWEGKTFDELSGENAGAVEARRADKWSFRPPGGESYSDLSERIRPWLKGLDRPTVAVSHGGVSRAVRGLLLDLPNAEIPLLEVPQDKIYIFEDGQGFWL